MNYFAKQGRSVQATQARLGAECPTVRWAQREWPVLPGTATRRQDLVAGGYQLNADLKFCVAVATFLGFALGDLVVGDAATLKDALLQTEIGYLDDGYKVMAVRIAAGGTTLEVECNGLAQGA